MTSVLAIMGGAGGIIAVLAAIIVIGRGIFRQVNVTEELTSAVGKLTEEVTKLRTILNGHETRISILEDRMKR